jgi:hypothetical protein
VGWQGSIDLWLSAQGDVGVTARQIVDALSAGGWTTTDPAGPGVSFVPFDGDLGDWRIGDGTRDDALAAVEARQERGLAGGLVVTWQRSGIGGSLLLHGDGHASLSASINPRRLATDTTDFSWYIERLLPALNRANLQVQRIEAADTD